ncbi:MAG: hypothetical protein WC994_09935 [Brumimicrobium sp.]
MKKNKNTKPSLFVPTKEDAQRVAEIVAKQLPDTKVVSSSAYPEIKMRGTTLKENVYLYILESDIYTDAFSFFTDNSKLWDSFLIEKEFDVKHENLITVCLVTFTSTQDFETIKKAIEKHNTDFYMMAQTLKQVF